VNSGTRQRDKQTETLTASCGGFFVFRDWVRCKPPRGRWGRRAGESPRLIAPSMGPVSKKGTRKLANGTRFPGTGPANQQLGPAIEYSNLLGLKLLFPAVECVAPQSIPRPLRRGNSQQFQLAQFTMTGGNSGNRTRPTIGISNWDPLLSGQLIFKGVNCNGTIECGAIQLQFGNPNSGNCSSDLRAFSMLYELELEMGP
jgi:hypothetical protein